MAAANEQNGYVEELRRGIIQAICEVSFPESDPITGDPRRNAFIGPTQVCEALTNVLGEFLEGVPALDTRRDIRAISDIVAKKLCVAIPEIRSQRARTGSLRCRRGLRGARRCQG